MSSDGLALNQRTMIDTWERHTARGIHRQAIYIDRPLNGRRQVRGISACGQR